MKSKCITVNLEKISESFHIYLLPKSAYQEFMLMKNNESKIWRSEKLTFKRISMSFTQTYEMLCAIWYHFVQSKKREKHPVLLLPKLQAEAQFP